MNFITTYQHKQPVVYSELGQTLKMERFTKIFNDWKLWTIFEKRSVLDVLILDVLDLSKYASALLYFIVEV